MKLHNADNKMNVLFLHIQFYHISCTTISCNNIIYNNQEIIVNQDEETIRNRHYRTKFFFAIDRVTNDMKIFSE